MKHFERFWAVLDKQKIKHTRSEAKILRLIPELCKNVRHFDVVASFDADRLKDVKFRILHLCNFAENKQIVSMVACKAFNKNTDRPTFASIRLTSGVRPEISFCAVLPPMKDLRNFVCALSGSFFEDCSGPINALYC